MGARDEYKKVLTLCSIANYTQYRKVVLEVVKCHLAQSEYIEARDIITLLVLKDLPPDVYDTLDPVQIFKGSRQLGFLFLLAEEGIRQMKVAGFCSPSDLRAFDIKVSGVLEAGYLC